MELLEFDLTWIPHPISECLSGAGPLDVYETDVEVLGPSPVSYVLPLGYNDDSGMWYGLLPDLDDILRDTGWSYGDIDGFAVDGQHVNTGVSVRLTTVVPWDSFQTHAAAFASEEQRPTPSVDEIRALEQRPTTWELGQRPVAWIGEDASEAELTYIAIVHDPNFLRATRLQSGGAFDAEGLAELVHRASGVPSAPAQPVRPRTIRLSDADLARELKPLLDVINIGVEVADTPLAEEALEEVSRYFLGESPPPYFVHHDPDTIRAFFTAARRFFAVEPWTRLEGDRFVGVQINDGPWRFVNVMGQMAESPGLSIFDDWMQVCRFMHNEDPPFFDLFAEAGIEFDELTIPTPLDAAGALEAVSGEPRSMLHPEDAAFLDALDLGPLRSYGYPVPTRFDAMEGAIDPVYTPDVYRVVMESLRRALDARSATPITSIKASYDVDGTSVTLRYPSDGTERPYDGPPGFRLTVRNDDDVDGFSPVPRGHTLRIDASATTLLSALGKALRAFSDDIFEGSFYEGPFCLWNDNDRRRNPSPRVADLAALDDLALELGGASFPLSIRPLAERPDDVAIAFVETP